jgi:hypothetical protein
MSSPLTSASNRSVVEPSHFIGGVFERDIPVVKNQLLASKTIDPDSISIVLEYLTNNENPFGMYEWINRGFDPGPEPEWSKELTDFLYGPDPIDPTKQVTETHYPPVFQPSFLTNIQTREVLPISIKTYYKIGLPFDYHATPLRQKERPREEASCWIVMRKGLLKETRNKPVLEQVKVMKALNANTGARYEVLPSIIDLASVMFVQYVLKKELNFGDRPWTFSRVAETMKSNGSNINLSFGGDAPWNAYLRDRSYVCENDCVTALRKFSNRHSVVVQKQKKTPIVSIICVLAAIALATSILRQLSRHNTDQFSFATMQMSSHRRF